jgi:hypothetical protein
MRIIALHFAVCAVSLATGYGGGYGGFLPLLPLPVLPLGGPLGFGGIGGFGGKKGGGGGGAVGFVAFPIAQLVAAQAVVPVQQKKPPVQTIVEQVVQPVVRQITVQPTVRVQTIVTPVNVDQKSEAAPITEKPTYHQQGPVTQPIIRKK